MCSAYGIEVNKSDLRFINQGSYIIGTAIYGKNIDIDYYKYTSSGNTAQVLADNFDVNNYNLGLNFDPTERYVYFYYNHIVMKEKERKSNRS